MKRTIGVGRIAEQAGQWGYFAVVELAVTRTDHNNGYQLDYLMAEPEWRSGIEFGVAYAFDKYRGGRPAMGGLNITVSRIEGHDVDTTPVVVAFAAASALFSALEVSLPVGMRIAADRGEIVFPK